MKLVLLGQSLIAHDLRQHPWPGRDALAALLASGDACFTDLETALDLPGAGAPTREGQYLHVAPPAVLDCLAELSVDLLCLANNHAWDRGTAGIVATLDAARARGFTCAGTGRNLAEASAPAFRDTPVGRVGLVCCASGKIREGAAATSGRPGVNELRLGPDATPEAEDLRRFLDAIGAAAGAAEAVIACLHNHHWETNPSDTPPWQRDLARAAIEAGASVFVGHGSPMMQGTERHRGRPIFHGLGSFIFQSVTRPGHYPEAAWRGAVMVVDTVSGAVERHRLVLDEAGLIPGTRGRPTLVD